MSTITREEREKKMKTLIIALLSIVSTSAYADGITLGTPAYAGTGCAAGSAAAVLSPDATQLSVLFDSFVATAGGASGKTIDRKACNLAIPVHVPQGFSVSLIEVDYRGYNAIPAGGRTQFNVEYFFAGSQGPRYSRTFTGAQSADYNINNKLLATAVVWSPCGQDVILRTNTSITALTNNRFEETMSTVDSADFTSGIVYQLQWRTCH